MCMNRKFSPEEQANHAKWASYAKRILCGANVAEVAIAENVSENEIHEAIVGIEKINPYLFGQIKAMLYSKEIMESSSVNEVAAKENVTAETVISWFETIKEMYPDLYNCVMSKFGN